MELFFSYLDMLQIKSIGSRKNTILYLDNKIKHRLDKNRTEKAEYGFRDFSKI